MTIVKYILTLLVASVSLLLLPAGTAEASSRAPYNGTVVEVVNHLPSKWPVSKAVSGVDYYTGSSIHMVSKCSGKHDCVTMVSAKLSHNHVAETGFCTSKKGPQIKQGFWLVQTYYNSCQIKVDVKRTNAKPSFYNYATRLHTLRHELGHWRGITWHNSSCSDVMYYATRCHGHLPGYSFSAGERKVLRKN